MAARAKGETVKYGADVIKVCASKWRSMKGDQPGTPQYTFGELQRSAGSAQIGTQSRARTRMGTQSIKDAIRAGTDLIEHSSLIDDEGIALAKQHGTYWCSTFTPSGLPCAKKARTLECCRNRSRKRKRSDGRNVKFSARPKSRRQKSRSEPTRECIRTATTQGSSPRWGSGMGMKPIDAILQAATIKAADLIGWPGQGRRDPELGHFADVIAVSGDPDVRRKTTGNVAVL